MCLWQSFIVEGPASPEIKSASSEEATEEILKIGLIKLQVKQATFSLWIHHTAKGHISDSA